MLSLERTRELLDDPTLTDKEVQEIRDGFYLLAEIIFEKWREEKKERPLYLKNQKRYCNHKDSP